MERLALTAKRTAVLLSNLAVMAVVKMQCDPAGATPEGCFARHLLMDDMARACLSVLGLG